MEEQKTILETEIGTIEKEMTQLEPKNVKIVRILVENIEKAKSDKVIFECEHPDAEKTIKISSVSYIEGNQVATTGTWVNLDKDNKIQKGSALALLMNWAKVEKVTAMANQDMVTCLEGKYLAFKAY